jgi:hypothetical protein
MADDDDIFVPKIMRFKQLLEQQMLAHGLAKGLARELIDYCVSVHFARRYTRIDTGRPDAPASEGRYLVDNWTGQIFGLRAYGVPNKKKQYGTLDTIDDWDWGGYTAVRKSV